MANSITHGRTWSNGDTLGQPPYDLLGDIVPEPLLRFAAVLRCIAQKDALEERPF